MITVGLPVYNANKIAWLAVESLCNQVTTRAWELVICEEKHINQCGEEYFKQYNERLKAAGCVKVVYIELEQWVNLPTKWKLIGENADKNSECFILQGADDYSSADRIELSAQSIIDNDCDWYDEANGYFYDVFIKKLIRFNKNTIKSDAWKTGLNMALKTSYIKSLPSTVIINGVDNYIFNHVLSQKPETKLYCNQRNNTYSLDINGLNNLSTSRQMFFINPSPPFEKTNMRLRDLTIVKEITDKVSLNYSANIKGKDVKVKMLVDKSEMYKGKEYMVNIDKAQHMRNVGQCEYVDNNITGLNKIILLNTNNRKHGNKVKKAVME